MCHNNGAVEVLTLDQVAILVLLSLQCLFVSCNVCLKWSTSLHGRSLPDIYVLQLLLEKSMHDAYMMPFMMPTSCGYFSLPLAQIQALYV